MSAWIVSRSHIDALVKAALDTAKPYGFRWDGGEVTVDNVDEIGCMLWTENVRSIFYRYPDTVGGDDFPGPLDFTPDQAMFYEWDRELLNVPVLDSATILKAIDCYEYQSCEHPEWDSSSAKNFCEKLRRSVVQDLPGYDAAPWGIDNVHDAVKSTAEEA